MRERKAVPTDHKHYLLSIEVPKQEAYIVAVQVEDVLNADCNWADKTAGVVVVVDSKVAAGAAAASAAAAGGSPGPSSSAASSAAATAAKGSPGKAAVTSPPPLQKVPLPYPRASPCVSLSVRLCAR